MEIGKEGRREYVVALASQRNKRENRDKKSFEIDKEGRREREGESTL